MMRHLIPHVLVAVVLAASLCLPVGAEPRLFIDLSPAQAVNDTPTPNAPSAPVTRLEVAPGDLVRVSVGYEFAPAGSMSRWYLLSAYLPIVHPHLTLVTPDRLQPENNAFWHSAVGTHGLQGAVKLAVSPETPPLRANLMKPLSANDEAFCDSGAMWVVLAPGGNTQTGAFYVGHVYVRVAPDAPAGTEIPIRLESITDAQWTKPNTLVATDSPARYHLIGAELPAQEATIVVRQAGTILRARVGLNDFVGEPARVNVQVEVRPVGRTDTLRTYETTLSEEFTLEIPVDLQGTYDIAIKASHWLRRVVKAVNLSGEVNLNVSLLNGDIDGDNEVTLFDFGKLVAAFGSSAGDASWNENADLDGDEEVTLFDFGILVRNFGATGDE